MSRLLHHLVAKQTIKLNKINKGNEGQFAQVYLQELCVITSLSVSIYIM